VANLSVEAISHDTTLSRRTVQRALRDLEDCGLILPVHRPRGGQGAVVEYQIVFAQIFPKETIQGVVGGSVRASLGRRKGVVRASSGKNDPNLLLKAKNNFFSAGSLQQPAADWGGPLQVIPQTLDALNAPEDLYDPKFWQTIHAWIDPHPQVAYLEELRRYIAWWSSKAPSRRHRDRQRGFTSWLREAESRANWRTNGSRPNPRSR
jgi:hypothetical protein